MFECQVKQNIRFSNHFTMAINQELIREPFLKNIYIYSKQSFLYSKQTLLNCPLLKNGPYCGQLQ